MPQQQTDVFALIQQGLHREEILKATAQLTQEQIQQAADRLTEPQIRAVESYVAETLQLGGIERMLTFGCLLELWATASKEADTPEPFHQMCERLGIRRGLGYEYRRVWREFGKRLVQQPRLAQFVVAEALKILGRESTPFGAVEEAFALAAQGQFVSIKVANELKSKHLQTTQEAVYPISEQQAQTEFEPAPDLSAPAQTTRSLVGSAWEFTGRVLRIVASAKDVDAIIRDLKQAIQKLEYERNVSTRLGDYYSAGEENHA